jgi:hypothetical protein
MSYKQELLPVSSAFFSFQLCRATLLAPPPLPALLPACPRLLQPHASPHRCPPTQTRAATSLQCRLQPCVVHPLLDSSGLPSAWDTRQSAKNTRQTLYRVPHSANWTRHRLGRQSMICRVSNVGHSAKHLPNVKDVTRQRKALVDEILTVGLPSVNHSTLGKACTVCRVSYV